MARVAAKLVIIFLLTSAGVYVGYGQLEKRLLVTPSVVPHHPAQGKPAEKTRQVLQKTSNYQIIVDRNIFEAVLEQKLEPKKKEPVLVEKEPEPTTLKLILQGTVAGNDQDARAIIVDQKERKQDIYQIGDAVQSAFITAIERGKVVLEVNGKKQLLLIKDREGGGGGRGNGVGVSGSVPRSRPSTVVRKPSRTAFSKKSSKPTPAVEPHRRISFKQGKDEENGDIDPVEQDESVEPLVEEDLQEDVVPPEGPGMDTESQGDDVVPPEGPGMDTESQE